MTSGNHRAAFANDPRFMARVAAQLGEPKQVSRQKLPGKTVEEPSATPKKSAATRRAEKVAEINKESRFDSLHFDPDSGVLTAVLSGAALLGLNPMLRMHDAKASKLKATWRKRIEALRYENPQVYDSWRKAARFPLIVEEVYITAESSCLDSEAVCAGCKPIIDAFVREGFLPDDDLTHIAHPIPYTRRGRNPGIVICFRPSPTPWGLVNSATIEAAEKIPPAR